MTFFVSRNCCVIVVFCLLPRSFSGIPHFSFALLYFRWPHEAAEGGAARTDNSHGGGISAAEEAPLTGSASKEGGPGIEYNTLLDLKLVDGSVADMSFGQYLARKWGDVFRG